MHTVCNKYDFKVMMGQSSVQGVAELRHFVMQYIFQKYATYSMFLFIRKMKILGLATRPNALVR
jgi:hypothetical protein